jgi:hypothetical protein
MVLGEVMSTVVLQPAFVAGYLALAQITSVTDPNAFRPDTPKTTAPAIPNTTSQVAPSAAGREMLNNSTVISLVKAGLGPEAIIAKINASNGSYETSTNSLISLKEAGVPDPVIAAMLQRSTSPVLSNAVADNTSPNPLDAHAPGIYLLDARGQGRMVRIDATVSNQTKLSNIWGYAFTSGIASMKTKTVIPNPSARVQATSQRPVFYFYFTQTGPLANVSQFGSAFSAMASSPNEFSLVRLEQKKDHREASIGTVGVFSGVKAGISDKARVSFSYEDVAPGVFKVTPDQALSIGQYGFIHSTTPGSGARIFDFSVN